MLETVEQAGQDLRGNAHAAVGNGKMQQKPRLVLDFDPSVQHHLAGTGEFGGIGEIVEQDLGDARRIAAQIIGNPGDILLVADAGAFQAVADEHAQPGKNGRKTKGDRFQFETASLDLGEIEDVVDHRQQMIGSGQYLAHPLLLARAECITHQQMAHADDCIDRSADFVAHVGEKNALGPAGLFRRFLGPRQGGVLLHQLGGLDIDDILEVSAIVFEFGQIALLLGDVEKTADNAGNFAFFIAEDIATENDVAPFAVMVDQAEIVVMQPRAGE